MYVFDVMFNCKIYETLTALLLLYYYMLYISMLTTGRRTSEALSLAIKRSIKPLASFK